MISMCSSKRCQHEKHLEEDMTSNKGDVPVTLKKIEQEETRDYINILCDHDSSKLAPNSDCNWYAAADIL
jgi:hypothetical protein